MNTKARILLVDDDPNWVRAVSRTLNSAGYEVLEASTARDGLRLAKEHRPDLVLLDVALPDADGIELCNRIKADLETMRAHMLLLSGAKTEADSQDEGLEMGADGYLVRPLSNRDLLAQVQAMLRIKRTEDALREREKTMRVLLNSFDDAVFSLDTEGRFLDLNVAAARWLGRRADELIGVCLYDLLSSEAAAFAKAKVEQVIQTGQPVRFEDQHGGRWHGQILHPISDAQGRVTGVAVIAHDITEPKRVEQALRESEERFRNLMNHVPGVSIQGYRTDGTIIYWNRASERVYGYAAEEAIGRNLGDLIVPPELKPLFLQCLEIGKGLRESGEFMPAGELLLLHKDGSRVPVYSMHTAVCLPDQEPVLFCLDVDLSERKRAEEALATRTEQLDALRAVTAEITRELDLTKLLILLTERVTELTGAGNVVVHLWEQAESVLIPRARHGVGPWVEGMRIRLGEGLVGRVAEQRQGLLANDYRTSPYAHPTVLAQETITAVMAEPLLYHDQLLGVLEVDNEGIGRPFSPEDQQILRLLATQAAITIENARLYADAQQQRREAEVLADLAQKIDSSLGLDTLLQMIAEGARELCGSDLAELGIRLDGNPGLTFRCWAGGHRLDRRDVSVAPGQGIAGIVLATGKPFRTANYLEDPRISSDFRAAVEAEGTIGQLSAPIRMAGEVEGVLQVINRSLRPFSDRDENILLRLANHAAIAIHNARLYAQLANQRDQLRALSMRAMEMREEETRRIARELHDEVGQSLTGMLLGLQGMEGARTYEEVREKTAELRALVSRSMEDLHNLVAALRPTILDDFGLAPALERYLHGIATGSGLRIRSSLTGLQALRLPPSIEIALFRIVQEAMTNVVKHARAHNVNVRVEHWGDAVVLFIEDDGQGFDVAKVRRDRKHSMGLGLLSMEERATLLGGTLVVQSSPGRGTTLVVEIPLPKD